jgi:hypothetical protein
MIRGGRRVRQTSARWASWHPWLAVTREVASDRVARTVFAAVALVVGFAYSILLPFDFTQRISFANWHYLDGRYLAFSVAFALGIAWVVSLQVHAMRRLVRAATRSGSGRTGGIAGIVAAVGSLLPSFLCCSPFVPTVVGLLGLSAATRLETTGSIQYFFASWQDAFLLGALALVVLSGVWSTRKLARASCLAGACSPAGQQGERPTATPSPPAAGRPDDDRARRIPAAVTAAAEPVDRR